MEEENRWKVNLNPIYGDSNLIAVGEAVLDNRYVLSPVKIVKNPKAERAEEAWMFSLPNIRRTRNGETVWEGAFEFVSQKARKEFERAMMTGIHEALGKGISEPSYEEVKLKIDVKPMDYKSVKGIATIQYEDVLQIKNVKIMEGSNGAFISYPRTEEAPDKEKKEFQSAMKQIKERLLGISGSSGLPDSARQEIDNLLQYVENQESKLNQVKYKDVIQPESYLFGSHVEHAVLKEFNSSKNRCQNQKNQLDEKKKKPVLK